MVGQRHSVWMAVLVCAGAIASCDENRIVAIGRAGETGGAAGVHDGGAGEAGASGTAGKDGGDAEAGADAHDAQGKDGETGAGGKPDGAADSDAAVTVQDCSQECGSDYCAGQGAGTTCSQCLFLTVCVRQEAAAVTTGAVAYQTCAAGCSSSACLDTCCSQEPQGCWATRLEQACACGYAPYDCKSACVDSCAGTMSSSCRACMKYTPCGMNLYDYETNSDVQGRTCLDGCGSDQTCALLCCMSYPGSACAAYQLAATCVCGG